MDKHPGCRKDEPGARRRTQVRRTAAMRQDPQHSSPSSFQVLTAKAARQALCRVEDRKRRARRTERVQLRGLGGPACLASTPGTAGARPTLYGTKILTLRSAKGPATGALRPADCQLSPPSASTLLGPPTPCALSSALHARSPSAPRLAGVQRCHLSTGTGSIPNNSPLL